MIDLSTTYLGLNLRSPLVASASPLSKRVDQVRRMEEAGAGAVVLFSLFEEQITHESRELDFYLNRGAHSFSEAITYLPELGHYNIGPESYLEHVRRVKEAVGIPVIGSLNGVSSGGWVEYAQLIEEAGADALELNIYYLPADPEITGKELELNYLRLVQDVRRRLSIPLAVKLSPFFTALPHMARRLASAGANGLVLFNRFYQPDFDLEQLEVVPGLRLSDSGDLLLPLRWIAILYGRVQADLALTSGVHTGEDVIKAMMAGAKVAMTTAALLEHGVGRIASILDEVRAWMEAHEYDSIGLMQGSMSQQAVAQPEAFERANYMRALNTFDRWVV